MPQTLPIDPPSNRLDQLAPKAVHVLGLLATLGAVAFMALLAVRPINSPDIGYHLAYGEHFLATGQIVQTNKWVFTPLDPKIMTDPAQLGPGCSFDAATNTYRFVNANWLSQAAMAAVKRVGGMNGLVALQAGLIVLLAVLLVVAMRRHGAPWHWVAPGVLMVALITDVRMPLRPELFGLPILVAQWALLSGKRFEWKHLAGVTVLQILMVNLHSYFLLGIAMAGAIFVQRRLEWLKRSGKWFKVEHLVWVVVLQIPVLGVYGILGLGNFWTILLDAAHIGGAIAIFFLLEDRQPQQGMETVGVNPLETGAPAPLAPQPTAPKTPPPLPPLPLPGPPAPSPAEVAVTSTRTRSPSAPLRRRIRTRRKVQRPAYPDCPSSSSRNRKASSTGSCGVVHVTVRPRGPFSL